MAAAREDVRGRRPRLQRRKNEVEALAARIYTRFGCRPK
jgi:hypothetical protein